MNRYYYKKNSGNAKRMLRHFGLLLSMSGGLFLLYFSFPLISWRIYLSPVYASQGFMTPIPKTTVLNKSNMQNLLAASLRSLDKSDYSNVQNWYPGYAYTEAKKTPVSQYTLSIPKIKIKDALVSTVDTNIDIHLVNYPGTAVPPDKGNAVIFGHSTLPQLFNPKNYKTIFANAHTLKVGDEIIITVADITYMYKIFNITIVEPEDTGPLAQEYDDSYITIITCTPPGTVWKRLILKARLEKI